MIAKVNQDLECIEGKFEHTFSSNGAVWGLKLSCYTGHLQPWKTSLQQGKIDDVKCDNSWKWREWYFGFCKEHMKCRRDVFSMCLCI